MPRKPKPVSGEVKVRLERAQAEVEDRRESYTDALAQRDRIVVEAVDVHGMAQQAVADAIGVRKGRISAILSGSQPDVGHDQ